MKNLKIATRKSPLALWQANAVKGLLEASGFGVELYPLTTTGDKLQSGALSEANVTDVHSHLTTGKGLFVREIQHALLSGEASVAVHSMKDLPVTLTPSLHIPALLPRADVRDVLIASPDLVYWLKEFGVIEKLSLENLSFDKLSRALCACPLLQTGRGIGTTSARRQMWVRKFFGEKTSLHLLRGNVDSRLKRVRQNEFSAILLAKAGLDRLGLFCSDDMIVLPADLFIPAPAQGAVAIELPVTLTKESYSLASQNRLETLVPVLVERWALTCMGGDCHMAVALHCDNNFLLHVGWQKEDRHVETIIDISLFKKSIDELSMTYLKLSYSLLAEHFSKSLCARFIYDGLKTQGIVVVDGIFLE